MAVQSQIYADFSSVGMPFDELLQQQQQQQNQFLLNHQQLQSQFLPSDINNNNNNNNNNSNFVFSAMRNKPTNISMAFSDMVTSQFENQRVEIDKYINLQNERLKLALREQRKQQLVSFIRRLEFRVATVTRRKDEEISQARKRAMDLQEYMKRMEMENQGWRRIAGETEAMIANLNATIEQLRDKAAIRLQQQQMQSNYCHVEDAESCCDVSFGEEEEAEETGERNSKRRKKMMMMVCRRCNSGDSSMLLLPCRHLCCCKACEAFLYACPVCNSAKEGSIEALFS